MRPGEHFRSSRGRGGAGTSGVGEPRGRLAAAIQPLLGDRVVVGLGVEAGELVEAGRAGEALGARRATAVAQWDTIPTTGTEDCGVAVHRRRSSYAARVTRRG